MRQVVFNPEVFEGRQWGAVGDSKGHLIPGSDHDIRGWICVAIERKDSFAFNLPACDLHLGTGGFAEIICCGERRIGTIVAVAAHIAFDSGVVFEPVALANLRESRSGVFINVADLRAVGDLDRGLRARRGAVPRDITFKDPILAVGDQRLANVPDDGRFAPTGCVVGNSFLVFQTDQARGGPDRPGFFDHKESRAVFFVDPPVAQNVLDLEIAKCEVVRDLNVQCEFIHVAGGGAGGVVVGQKCVRLLDCQRRCGCDVGGAVADSCWCVVGIQRCPIACACDGIRYRRWCARGRVIGWRCAVRRVIRDEVIKGNCDRSRYAVELNDKLVARLDLVANGRFRCRSAARAAGNRKIAQIHDLGRQRVCQHKVIDGLTWRHIHAQRVLINVTWTCCGFIFWRSARFTNRQQVWILLHGRRRPTQGRIVNGIVQRIAAQGKATQHFKFRHRAEVGLIGKVDHHIDLDRRVPR